MDRWLGAASVGVVSMAVGCSSAPPEREPIGTSQAAVTWVEQQMLVPDDGKANQWFGRSVSLSGNTALV